MSLQVSFDICQSDCDLFCFSETTGLSSPADEGGWAATSGEPNPEISEALTAVLSTQFPDQTTYLPSGTPIDYDLFAQGFPKSAADLFTISYEDLGGDEDTDFPEGIYYFQYLVTGDKTVAPDTGAFSSSDGGYWLFACQTRCCLNKAAMQARGCGCDSKEFEQADLGLTLLRLASNAARCGDIEEAAELFKEAKNICVRSGCNC